ncbi:sulfurtransferase [Roseibium polysiphoniae]|uniref:Sulfurtransferase n=1 Tax=Roseibium polysiphoniae TaxID=2571221 RepID=A0A944CDT6_9HYPH|nr:sulfurtransferase/chromate resistance protein [Roseibium polysiphoniae]MBS8261284.1 sulfurtransferase [Roseibium polysiphoniae]
MPAPNQITVSQLNRLIGTPDCPVLVDVRIDEDFEVDRFLVPGSFRHPHDQIDTLVERLRGQRAIIICHKGKKLSEGVAAWLRHENIETESLEGGMVAWHEAGLPRVNCRNLPQRDAKGRTVWVTRLRPKVDRIACPWLIRRFVDPSAVFLFVAKQEVTAVAERFDATPFDIEGLTWSHRGENCTFDTMIEEFGLSSDPLLHLARIVRGADTERLDLEPQCAGLLAASLGLSRMYRDDVAQLEAGLALYDAFYRWCRDATSETHDWPEMHSGK